MQIQNSCCSLHAEIALNLHMQLDGLCGFAFAIAIFYE